MEFNDVTNAVSTEDFYDMFSGKASFADEAPVANNPVDNIEDLQDMKIFNDESGNMEQIDFDNIIDDPFNDLSDTSVDLPADELADWVAVNGVKVEREEIEKALNAYSGVKEWGEQVNQHFEELDAFQEGLDRLYSISHSEINGYIEQLQNTVDNPRIDPASRMEAYNELVKYKNQQAAIEAQYKESHASLQARKASAERLKGNAIGNELRAMGWKPEDYELAGKFMQENGIVLAAKDASSSLMVAIRKAALYDAEKNKLKEEARSNTAKAITGTATRSSKAITPVDEARKNKARQMANEGTLTKDDMFKYLID